MSNAPVFTGKPGRPDASPAFLELSLKSETASVNARKHFEDPSRVFRHFKAGKFSQSESFAFSVFYFYSKHVRDGRRREEPAQHSGIVPYPAFAWGVKNKSRGSSAFKIHESGYI